MAGRNKKPTNTSSIPQEMDWSHFSPIEVKVQGSFERAFKIFRSLVQAEKVLSLYKEKQAYEKPSVKRRRKSSEHRQRMLELEARERKIRSGEYEKEKARKQAKKERKRAERQNNRPE